VLLNATCTCTNVGTAQHIRTETDMSGPRVHNGQEWLPVPAVTTSSSVKPIPPIFDGDGKIFVSIVSYRGTFVRTYQSHCPFMGLL
jgi:hypothetical protein